MKKGILKNNSGKFYTVQTGQFDSDAYTASVLTLADAKEIASWDRDGQRMVWVAFDGGEETLNK